MVRWNWVLPVVVLALLVFGFFFVRPLDPLPPDPDAEATARAWNDAVGRLGIQPVFPPEEDFHVGDVWAVIADTEDRPLLGRAIRIGHLDLRQVLLESQAGRPVFADTAMDTNGVKLKQAPAEVEPPPKNDRITLSLAAFPGVTIRHAVRADADLSGLPLAATAGRAGVAAEEIRIPVAETYGVAAASAAGRLQEWCQAPATQLRCTDAFVRKALAAAVSERVHAVKDGRFAVRLQLRVVNRVFLTREMLVRREHSQAGGVAAAASLDLEQSQPALPVPIAAGAGSGESPGAPAAPATRLPASGRAATMGAARQDRVAWEVKQVFQRPVVFGFRSVSFDLTPSDSGPITTVGPPQSPGILSR